MSPTLKVLTSFTAFLFLKQLLYRLLPRGKSPSITVDGLNAGENAYYIRGKISAKDDKSFSVITYNLYDKDNNLLGTAVAGLNSLEKDKVYDFEAIALLEQNDLTNIDHYELESVELGN